MDVSRTVRANGVDLFVRELGPDDPDGPPLVVVHGGPDWDHSYLLPGIEPVARQRHVILFDLRGCGRSAQGLGPEGYQPEYLVEDLRHLLALLGQDQVDLLGFSTGGQVAQLFVQAHPYAVRRLVLASTTAYGDVARHREGWAEAERRLSMRADWPSWAPPRPVDPQGAELTLAWALDGAPSAIWDLSRLSSYLELLSRVRFSGEWIAPFLSGALHPWRPTDPEATLREFGRPVLVLHGEQDMTFPVAVARRLAAAVPNAVLRVLHDAGHMAHVDRPAQWAAAVTDFVC